MERGSTSFAESARSHRFFFVPMLAVALCLAYALGCLSPGWWLVRRKTGGDLRATGSGGTGATNAARVLGGWAFAVVLLLDAGKTAIAVLVARVLLPGNPWHALAMPAAVAGHIWPAQLRFKGGRGAGPLLGGCVALNPWFLVAAAAPAALVAVFVRRTFALTTAAALVVLAHRAHFVRAWHRPVP